MADVADLLDRRARLIGHALKDVPGDYLYRWGGYDRNEPLIVDDYGSGGQDIRWRRAWNSKGHIRLFNIRLDGPEKPKASDPIPTGKPVQQDAYDVTVENKYSLSEYEKKQRQEGNYDIGVIRKHYTANFSSHTIKTKDESFEKEFSQSISNTFSASGSYGGVEVSNETTVEAGFRQAMTEASGEERGTSSDRESGYEIVVQPGTVVKVWGTRVVQPKKIVLTGTGRIEHAIELGRWAGSRWHRRKGKYKRHVHWDSLEDFMKVLVGDGPRDHDLALWFREHPHPHDSWLLEYFRKPLGDPLVVEVPWDDVTDEDIQIRKVSGPKDDPFDKYEEDDHDDK